MLMATVVSCQRTSAPPNAPPMQIVLEPLGTQGTVQKSRDLSRVEAHLLMASASAIGGPCLMPRTNGATAFGVLREEGKRALVALPLNARGLPQAGSMLLGALNADTGTMSCGATKNASVVAVSQLLDRGEAIVTASISNDAKTVTRPTEVLRTPHHVVWLRVISGAKQSALFWVEEQADGHASLRAVALSDTGSTGMAVRLASDIVGWHAQLQGDGFAIAWIADGAGKKKLITQRYNGSLAALGGPQLVTSADQFRGDLFGDSTGDFLVLGWTEGNQDAARSHVSVISPTTVGEHVAIDREATELLNVSSAPGGAYVVWRPVAHRDHLRVARLRARQDTLIAALEIESDAKGSVEVAGLPSGLSILGSFRTCPAGRCEGEFAFSPAFLRVSAAMQVSEAHPMTVPSARHDEPPAMAWNLRCAGEDCVALSAVGGSETRVFVHDLGPRSSLYALAGMTTATVATEAAQAPASGHTETVLDDVPIVDYAAVGAGDTRAVASLREVERPSKRTRGLDVVLDVWSPRRTHKIATGASPTGQIAMAREPDGSLVLVWVESDRNASALRLMRVTKDGRVLRDVRLAPSVGDKTHVALVRLVDDPKSERKWLLSWIDARHKHGEIYAMALNARFRRVAIEQRLVESGDVDALTVRLDAGRVWLAWTAHGESSGESTGESDRDVYRAAIDSHFSTLVAPSKVAATVTDSYAPHFRLDGDTLSLVWVERPVGNLGATDGGAYGAWTVPLDRATGVVGRPAIVVSSATVGEALADDHSLWVVRGGQNLTLERIGPGHAAPQVFALSAEPPFEPIVQSIDNGLYVLDTGSQPARRRLKFMRP